MPSANTLAAAYVMIGCCDPRCTEHFNEFEARHPGSYPIRFAGGASKMLTSENALGTVLETVDALLLVEPEEVHIHFTSHTGRCRGLEVEYGDRCDHEAEKTLPLAVSHFRQKLKDKFPLMDVSKWKFTQKCLEIPPANQNGHQGVLPLEPASNLAMGVR